MAVSGTPTTPQSLFSQINPAAQSAPSRAAPQVERGPEAPAPRLAAAEQRVKIPEGATTLDPNAPRGTYLNLKV
jgi:hypothetical protein